MSQINRQYQPNLRVYEQISLPKVVRVHNPEASIQTGSGRYMPALDGLRTLAVLAVIAYHLNFTWASGGLLGVCLFFVLSGYLITDLLTVQWSLSGRLDLKEFWLRRARRLLPALFVLLAGVMAWGTIFAPAQLTTLGEDTLAAIFYASNWWLIFHQVSYFASFGPPSPLGHLWSLAVEEQFYLVWPLLLWLGLHFIASRKRLAALTFAGILVSALAMFLIYQPGTDPSRVYYGTDTRAFAFLIGAALALVWPSGKLSARLSPRAGLALDLVGGAGLLVMLWMISQSNEYDTFLYRGGLLLFSLASALVVAVLAHPASQLSQLFGQQPWRWLGLRSYGIYLWHYPVIIWTSPAVNTGGRNVLLTCCQMAATLALAGLSWRFIEEPIRRGSWPGRQGRPERRQVLESVSGRITFVSGLIILGISCLAIIGGVFISNSQQLLFFSSAANTSQAETDQTGSQAGSEPTLGQESGYPLQGDSLPATQATGTAPSNKTDNSTTGADHSLNPPAEQSAVPETNAQTTPSPEAGQGITVIGDSVMVGAEPALKKLLPGIVISAQVGRQMSQAQSVVDQLQAKGELGKRVIIELGTNGPFTEEQLIGLLNSLGQAEQIVLVNTRVSRPWEEVVNQTLAQVAASYPHTTLVDWHSASSHHNDYFYPDGVHLNPTGIEAFAALLAHAVKAA